MKRTIPASHFVAQLEANLDSDMSDAAFRQMVRNTLPVVQYDTVAVIRARASGEPTG